MSQTKTHITAGELLSEIYKNVKMGADSVINLMSRASDEGLRLEMTLQLDRYEELARRAAALMAEIGMEPKEESPVTRAAAKVGMAMNTMADSTTSHLAEMLIQGSTMGVTDLLRKIGMAEESGIVGEVPELAREAASFEEDAVENLKKYL